MAQESPQWNIGPRNIDIEIRCRESNRMTGEESCMALTAMRSIHHTRHGDMVNASTIRTDIVQLLAPDNGESQRIVLADWTRTYLAFLSAMPRGSD